MPRVSLIKVSDRGSGEEWRRGLYGLSAIEFDSFPIPIPILLKCKIARNVLWISVCRRRKLRKKSHQIKNYKEFFEML